MSPITSKNRYDLLGRRYCYVATLLDLLLVAVLLFSAITCRQGVAMPDNYRDLTVPRYVGEGELLKNGRGTNLSYGILLGQDQSSGFSQKVEKLSNSNIRVGF